MTFLLRLLRSAISSATLNVDAVASQLLKVEFDLADKSDDATVFAINLGV